jgi:hypothetical protein
MTSDRAHVAVLRLLTLLALCLLGVPTLHAQEIYGAPSWSGAGPERGPATRDRIRTEVRFGFVSRNYALTNSDGTINLDAPFYPGARLALQLFPAAVFTEDHPMAAFGVEVEFGKHQLQTVTDIEQPDGLLTLQVPTRHDTTYAGIRYEARATDRIEVIPTLGWRVVEYALGFNPLLSNTFYRSFELGVGGRYLLNDAWSAQAQFALRPGVSLGSTAQAWGDDATALGWHFDSSVRWRSTFGLYADAGLRFERYTTRYEPGRSGIPPTTATDGFFAVLFALGYAL